VELESKGLSAVPTASAVHCCGAVFLFCSAVLADAGSRSCSCCVLLFCLPGPMLVSAVWKGCSAVLGPAGWSWFRLGWE